MYRETVDIRKEYTMNDHYKEAYERFYPDLLKSLPMADPHFHEDLEKKNLFFGDLSEEVKAKDTEARKAAHFLQNAISHSLKIDNTEPFDNLLEVMENFDNEDCKSLAKEIKTYLSKKQSVDPQTVVTMQPHPNITDSDDSDSNDLTHSELAVFEENYALLCNTIVDVIDPLMKYCVEEKIFTSEEETQIIAYTAVVEKLQLLLLKISSCLKAGDTRSFHIMLAIMKEHGGKGTQTLADHIMNRLKVSTDQLPRVSTFDTHVQYDKPKATDPSDIIVRMENNDPSVTLAEILKSNEAKKLRPTELYLNRLFIEKYATKWRNIGLELNITSEILDIVKVDHPTEVQARCRAMLKAWLQKDPEASWDKLLHAVEDTDKHYHISSIEIAIEKAQNRLYAYYTNKQFIKPEHDWPPYHFKYFTPLAIIYENIQTKPTIGTNTAEDQEHLDKTTEDINSLFSTYRGCQSYKILIEGEPGIGKTILSSEIAAQWANKTLLDDKALLFLLFMRQPETKNISNVKSLVEHFFHDNIPLVNEITEWLINSNGKHLTIILDGYDEASRYSAFFDFVNDIITHKTLPECGLVITSRPAESLHLHNRVNCRAEVLGFTEQSRQQFINLYIEKQEKEEQIYQTNKQGVIKHNISKKMELIQKVLKHNPIINTLCYIPLNITMLLLCLTESEEEIDLPTTTTTLYERFIIVTIKRFLLGHPGFTDTIFSFNDLPLKYCQTFKQLSKFAYSVSVDIDDKRSMQLVFELTDIEDNCKNFVSHGNGLGLLKPASFLNMGIGNKYMSYNFLHKSIQEYMAANHIASLPTGSLSSLLSKKFWDSSYFNIWIMYVGITGGEQTEFKYFLSGNRFKLFAPNPSKISEKILNDKIKCLHLLRCAAEAKESTLLASVQNLFDENVIDLSNKKLSESDTKTLAVLLLDLPGGPWMVNLSRCNITNKHCKVLFDTFTSQTVIANIKTIDISFNNISLENLYRLCHETFKLWKVEKIILPIDALRTSVTITRMEHFISISKGLIQTHRSSVGKVMIMYQPDHGRIIVVYSDLTHVKCFQLNDCELNEDTAKRLKQSITEELKGHRVGHIYFSYSIYDHHDVETLFYIVENFQSIKFCGLNMHSKGAYLLHDTSKLDFQIESDPSTCLVDFLMAVLHNNTQTNTPTAYLILIPENVRDETKKILKHILTVKILDLTNNNLSDCVVEDIEVVLSFDKLEELHLGGNNLQDTGMINIAEALQSNYVLKVFDISNNCINSKAANSIATALANKMQLEKLLLNGNQLQAQDITEITNRLQSTAIKVFNISHIMMNSTAANIIVNLLTKNTQLEELYLGGNILQNKGIFEILLGLENTSTLKVLDISNNNISRKAAGKIAHVLSKQAKLEKLILGGNNIQDGLTKIVKGLNCYSTLKILDISNNSASFMTIDIIAVMLCFQTKSQKLFLNGNNSVNSRTIQVLRYCLALTTFDISCDETTDDIQSIVSSHAAHMQMLFLSYNTEDFSVNEYMCKLPIMARLNLKLNKTRILRSAEIIREVRIKGSNLNELLKTPLNLLEDDCINSALLAAVESGSPINAGKLILHGATNIDDALAKSRKEKQYAVTAALLIIKAAIENDRILVLKLYGENVQGDTKIPLTEEDNLEELQAAVAGGNIRTVVPIEISRRNNASAVREELLLRTDVDKGSGVVSWFGLRLTQLEISWLKKIYWVKKLRLSHNEFSSLKPEMGSYLKQCTKLDLQWNRICEIPSCLLELPSINELNLSHNDIIDIPDIPEWSASLSVLDLSYNRLSNLPNSAVAPTLKNLNISHNQFHTVPHCVCSFVGLTTLNIAYNSEILALPSELSRLKSLLNLNLDGLNDLNDPPKSVRVTTADCIRYLNSRLRSTRGCYHMKMMLVGKQAMGKSTIVARLHNKEIGNESTVGVDVSEWKYAPAYNKKTFHFSIWDFAGLEEYYATHQCFLSKRSLYLLVWNVTEGDEGVADLKPWLNNISVRAPDSCIIVVGTFLDKVSEEDRQSGKINDLLRKVEELTRQYRRLVVTNITVVGLKGRMENVAKLKDYIYNAAAEYKIKNQYIMGHKIPSSYHALESELSTIHHLVKDGNHEPIMHAAEFQKMLRDLDLDILNDDDLSMAIQFLHEVGALLHYDDHRHNLDDLYFVDPNWLCDLMSTVVTVKQWNPHVKQGILRSKHLSLFFKGKHFTSKFFYQFLTLLNKFEIVLPLDNNYKRILVPSFLPEKCPDFVEQLDDENWYKHFIFFPLSNPKDQYHHPTNHNYAVHRSPIPPGLCSRLLLRIMNTVKKVRDILNKQVPLKDDLIMSTKSEGGSLEVFPIEGGGTLVYWRTGLFYNTTKLSFSVETFADNIKYHDKNGVVISASKTVEGCKILGQLIDVVEQFLTEWYPGLNTEQRVPCLECVKSGITSPCEFKVDQLFLLIADHKLSHNCANDHGVKLETIVPSLLFQDLDPIFLLDPKEVIYKQEKENLLGTGKFGEVHHGKYKGQVVAIKLYAIEGSRVEEGFKHMHSESKFLQQLCHPCIVNMIGVIIQPPMLLVMEEAPEGSLQVQLLKEQKAFSRIVLYRIAIQVASALHYLHSVNIIYRDLKAANVLLWSLSPDYLINCKVTNLNGAVYADPAGVKGLYGTKGFMAPEVTRVNLAKERSVYDHRADIFSFGMFLYELLARQHPFHNVQQFYTEEAIEKGQRPQIKDVSVAHVGFYYIRHVMKLCWNGNPTKRPTSQQIIQWLSASALQLTMSVVTVSNKHSVHNGCIVTPAMSNEVGFAPTSSELWIGCDRVDGAEMNIFTTNTMVEAGKHFVRERRVQCMKQCGEHVWVASRAGLEDSVVDIFNKNTKDLVHNIMIKENTISCITNSDRLVYIGTIKGYCFIYSTDIATIQQNSNPCYKCISEDSVDGMVLTHNCLWASTYNQIHLFNPETLDSKGVEKRTKNAHAFVGKIMISDDGDQMWSAHLGGVIMSVWNASQRVHMFDVDVGACAEERCHIGNPQERIMTAMCTALDTVWIGLASGHIMVFGMNPPGKLLTYFRPYNSYVYFLSASKYPGPCQKEECMMLCSGKMYRPDDPFKELTDYERKDEKGEIVDTAGVAVLWEVLPAKYMRQVQYLSDGQAWLNCSTLKKAMNETGFTDSMKYCQPTMVDSSTMQDNPHVDTSTGSNFDQQDLDHQINQQ